MGLAVAFVLGSGVHAACVNIDVSKFDQDLYIEGARHLRATHFSGLTNRAQMPLYIHLLALLGDAETPTSAWFARGKAMNIVIAIVSLLTMHGVLKRRWAPPRADLFIVIAAFTVFIFRAGYVQAELLFYALSFIAFVLLIDFWRAPSVKWAVMAGTVSAATHLTKGTFLPAFLFISGAFVISALGRGLRGLSPPVEVGRRAGLGALLVTAFLVPLWPYLQASKLHYGSYFFNANSTYALFCESWDDVLQRQEALGPWGSWHLLADERVPSLTRYLTSHSPFAIATRTIRGMGEALGNAWISHGYMEFLAVLGAAAWLAHRQGRTTPRLPGFMLPLAALYLAMFGFYAPVMGGNRFMLTLYLPALFGLLSFLPDDEGEPLCIGRWELTAKDITLLLTVMVSLHVAFRVPTLLRLAAGG